MQFTIDEYLALVNALRRSREFYDKRIADLECEGLPHIAEKALEKRNVLDGLLVKFSKLERANTVKYGVLV